TGFSCFCPRDMPTPSEHRLFAKREDGLPECVRRRSLPLQEAQRFMLSFMTDATTASQRVGYLSPSQFSRVQPPFAARRQRTGRNAGRTSPVGGKACRFFTCAPPPPPVQPLKIRFQSACHTHD